VKKLRLPSSLLVASGIFASRVSGLVREKIFAYHFGDSEVGGVFRAAQRIPNILQNLLGEGALSASFIPAYSRLLAEKRDEDARRLAGAIFGLLSVAVFVLVAVGVASAPALTAAIAPGFRGANYDLAVRLVRIFFPGVGALVLSAWCLGVLNSHRKFLLPYLAPVVMNATMVAALLAFGGARAASLAVTLTWSAALGGALVFAVQLPVALRLTRGLRPSLALDFEPAREVVRKFFPTLIGRGVVQLSAYADNLLASLISASAVGILSYAQNIYLLPVSLFGIAISAAELPELSSATGDAEEIAARIRTRLTAALRRMSFFVIPSSAALFILGDLVIGVLYRGGAFGEDAVRQVWTTLAAASVGLSAATGGRLYASAFFALRDTTTPLRYAVARVSLAAAVGTAAALYAPGWLGVGPQWGVTGLAAASALGGWLEFFLLRRALHRRIGAVTGVGRLAATLWLIALAAAGAAFAVKPLLGAPRSLGAALAALGAYGVAYFGLAIILRVPETDAVLRRLRRTRGRT
jgi:putative peptidoglycan lipid II flippase